MVGIILRIDFEQIGVIVAAKEECKMLHAIFMLVILTTAIMVLTARIGIGSVKSGIAPQNYCRLIKGLDIPIFFAKTIHNFNNLFEVPTLFYVGGAVYLGLGQTELIPLISA